MPSRWSDTLTPTPDRVISAREGRILALAWSCAEQSRAHPERPVEEILDAAFTAFKLLATRQDLDNVPPNG